MSTCVARSSILSLCYRPTLQLRYKTSTRHFGDNLRSNPRQYSQRTPNMSKLDIKIPTTELPDGAPIPVLGYGTGTAWFKKDASSPLELGQAIKESKVARDKLFVTTKVMQNIGDIPAALDASLKKLGLDYVDLYLIHAPFFAKSDQDLQEKWADMETLLASGKTKAIGVSNYMKAHIEATLATAKVRPAMNQIEYHPYLQHGELVPYLKNQNIRVAAYGPLIPLVKKAGGPLDPKLDELARKYAVNPGEILLRWSLDMGIVPITTTSKEQRMSDMLRVFTFTLNPKEVEDITEIGNSHHARGFWNHMFDENDRT
jgi:diketogulonate reductase-like aldo/keto reductase